MKIRLEYLAEQMKSGKVYFRKKGDEQLIHELLRVRQGPDGRPDPATASRLVCLLANAIWQGKPNAGADAGPPFENFCEWLSSCLFTPAAVFPQPRAGPNNAGREIADVVVWDKENLLIFQCKARHMGARKSGKGETVKWSVKAALQAAKQVKGAARILLSGRVKSMENCCGALVDFSPVGLRRVHGIVLLGDAEARSDAVQDAFDRMGLDFPLHIVIWPAFLNLVNRLSTPQALLAYLDTHVSLCSGPRPEVSGDKRYRPLCLEFGENFNGATRKGSENP